MVKIIVKPVSHISFSTLAPFSATLPVGSEMALAVDLRDERGDLFHSYDALQLEARVNLLGIVATTVDTSNQTHTALVRVSALAPGVTVLHVLAPREESPGALSGYWPITVTDALTPSDATVLVGSEIAFHPSFEPDPVLYRHTWSTSNPAVLSINAQTGKCCLRSRSFTR